MDPMSLGRRVRVMKKKRQPTVTGLGGDRQGEGGGTIEEKRQCQNSSKGR